MAMAIITTTLPGLKSLVTKKTPRDDLEFAPESPTLDEEKSNNPA